MIFVFVIDLKIGNTTKQEVVVMIQNRNIFHLLVNKQQRGKAQALYHYGLRFVFLSRVMEGIHVEISLYCKDTV